MMIQDVINAVADVPLKDQGGGLLIPPDLSWPATSLIPGKDSQVPLLRTITGKAPSFYLHTGSAAYEVSIPS